MAAKQKRYVLLVDGEKIYIKAERYDIPKETGSVNFYTGNEIVATFAGEDVSGVWRRSTEY